jgi:CubicO group peptidase (beta-lactamase class C family)
VRVPVVLLHLVVLSLPVTAASSGTQRNPEIDALARQFVRPDGPGAAIAVVHHGKVVHLGGYGLAQLEHRVPITPDTVFDLASNAKQFTALALFLLEREGKLSLNDDVRKYIPELQSFDPPIRIHHLLHHTSGLRDWVQCLALTGWQLEDRVTNQDVFKLVYRQATLSHPTGKRYLYSNTGYCLLAEIIERVSGEPFRAFCKDRIFDPLGMESTLVRDRVEEIVSNRADSYDSNRQGGWTRVLGNAAVPGSASLFSSAEDIAKWLANFQSGEVGGHQLLRRMMAPSNSDRGSYINYGGGLLVDSYKGVSQVRHGGAWRGYRSTIHYLPSEELGVAVLTNVPIRHKDLAFAIIDLFLKDRKPQPLAAGQTLAFVPNRGNGFQLASEDLHKYEGRFRIDPRADITVTREGEHLVLETGDEQRHRLLPRSATEFEVQGRKERIEFDVSPDGPAPRLTLFSGRKVQPAGRVRGAPIGTAGLSEYAGVYYSRELETSYTITHNEGQLIAKHSRNPDIKLFRNGGDQFGSSTWFFRRVWFQRGEDGEITGFDLSYGRAFNLVFTRQP